MRCTGHRTKQAVQAVSGVIRMRYPVADPQIADGESKGIPAGQTGSWNQRDCCPVRIWRLQLLYICILKGSWETTPSIPYGEKIRERHRKG